MTHPLYGRLAPWIHKLLHHDHMVYHLHFPKSQKIMSLWLRQTRKLSKLSCSVLSHQLCDVILFEYQIIMVAQQSKSPFSCEHCKVLKCHWKLFMKMRWYIVLFKCQFTIVIKTTKIQCLLLGLMWLQDTLMIWLFSTENIMISQLCFH